MKVVAEQTKLLGTAKPPDPFPLHPVQGWWSCWNLLTPTQPTWLFFTGASSTPRVIYGPPHSQQQWGNLWRALSVVCVLPGGKCNSIFDSFFHIPTPPTPRVTFCHLFLCTWGSCFCFLLIYLNLNSFIFIWMLCCKTPTCSRCGFCALSRS